MRHLLTVLVLAGVALAAPPVVTVPAEVKGDVGSFVAVKADVKDGKSVKFVVLDAGLNVFPAGLLADPTATVVTAGKPGKFRILCYSGNADGPSEPVTVTVVIGDGGKDDPKKPDPVKPQPDVAKAEKVAIVVVEESQQRTVKQAEQLTALHKWADAGGHTFFVIDKDDPTASKNGYLPHANSTGIPSVLVFDQKNAGKPLTVVKLDEATLGKVKEVVK